MADAPTANRTGTSPLYRALLRAQNRLMAERIANGSAAKMTHSVCDRYPLCECCVKPAATPSGSGQMAEPAFLILCNAATPRDVHANTMTQPPASDQPL